MWFNIRITLLLLATLSSNANAFTAPLEPFQATCPPTAHMEGNGLWNSGVRFTFDRAEIYIWNGTPQHLRCWYQSPVGGSAFLAGHNEVRNGYNCKIIESNKFECR